MTSEFQMADLKSDSLGVRVRSDFPILRTQMNAQPLIYLDNAATTQKPKMVIDAVVDFYSNYNSNIHRGVYELSQRATDAYELARTKVAKFISAPFVEECIFTRGTTEGVNLVARCWGEENVASGDVILLSELEHHSNIVPWQLLAKKVGAELKYLPMATNGQLDLTNLEQFISDRTRIVALQMVSNALGGIHDLHPIIDLAHKVGALVLLDAAQAVAHFPVSVSNLDCDFLVFSGHKLYGPTGIGILWGRRELLASMPPYQGGGDMIESVTLTGTTFAELPNKFEAGTPDIAGAIGLGAAIDYVSSIGFAAIEAHESSLLEYATKKLEAVPGLRILGNSFPKEAIISFVIDEPPMAALDIAIALSEQGIAIRTGHHCCMPLMHRLGVAGTCRISFAMYNTHAEIDRVTEVLTEFISTARARLTAVPTTNCDAQNLEESFGIAAGDSPSAVAQELIEEFLLFDDNESKTELLLELGQDLPNCFEQLKLVTTSVPGCMSEVYVIGRANPQQRQIFEFTADSNAQVVRGLIAVLKKLFSGQPVKQVLEFDVQQFFRAIGLQHFVSTQRRNGLEGMLKRIRHVAESILEAKQ
ncbi:MAG: SufS family cysteine desulfurase [Planctomycetales bacterium]|nr:SufS family cysteine desulfurase [Planctomycetales bacterium]